MKLGEPIDLTPEELAGDTVTAVADAPSPVAAPAAALPSAGGELAQDSPALGEPMDLTPGEIATAGAPAVAGPRLGDPIDALDDFEVYNAIEDDKEARGYDPTDMGIASKIWDGVKGIVRQIPAAAKGVAIIASPNYNPLGAPLAAQSAGKLLGNYNVLGHGAKTLFTKVGAEVGGWGATPEQKAELKRLSRKASFDFQRESRDTEQFTNEFNKHLETIYPEALKGLGSIPIDNEMAAGVAMVGDPANYAPGGAAAKWTAQVPLRGAVRAARGAATAASLDFAKATAEREAASLLLKPGLAAAERGELFRRYTTADAQLKAAAIRKDLAANVLLRTTEEQRAIVDQLASSAASQPLAQRVAAAGARGVGAVADTAGAGLQRVAALPEKLAGAVASGADDAARRGIEDGVRNIAGGFGLIPATTGATGALLRNAGRNLKVFGRVLSEAEGQLPFFKTLARETDGLTSYAASLVDQSGFGQVAAPLFRMTADATRGAPFGAGQAFVASGGDVDAAAQGLGGGMVFGMAGAGYGQWQRFGNPAVMRQRQNADVGRYRRSLPTAEAQAHFDAMSAGDRVGLATMQLAHPDLAIKHERLGKGKPSFYYAAEDGPVAVINLDTKDGINAVLAHEVGHHVERHGLGGTIERTLFGDPVLQKPGLFTEFDAKGDPVVGADGAYAKNKEWAELKEAYNARLQAHADRTGELMPPRDDAAMAREVFAEHVADHILRGELQGDLRSNVWSRAIGSIADSSLVTSSPAMRQILGKLGVPMSGQSRLAGSHLFPGGVAPSPALRRVIRDYHQKSARNAQPDIAEESGSTRYTSTEVTKHPEILEKLFDGSDDVARDKRGRVIRERDGRPKFQTPKEQKAQRAALADALTKELLTSPAASPVAGKPGSTVTPEPVARVERVVNAKTGAIEEGVLIPGIPDAVIDKLKLSEKFNPAQLEHLRQVSRQIRAGAGNSSLFFYQPATPGRGRYEGMVGDWRTETPYAIFISKAGNVVVRTMSREKLMANAQAMIARKEAGLWNNQLGELVKDIETYLENHANGRSGSEGIGVEKKKQINSLFGIGTKTNMAANPFLETSHRAPTIIRSRRIDRINQLTPVEEIFRTDYEKLNANLRPE